MNARAQTARYDGGTVTVQIGVTFRRRGGRKQVVAPAGATAWAPPRARVDSTLVKAIARAHRWQRLLESGEYASVAELAAAEKINPSYLARVLRLTLLAPDIIEAVLDGTLHAERLTLKRVLKPFAPEWERQRLLSERAECRT